MATGGPPERDVKDFAFKLAAKIRVDSQGTESLVGRCSLVAISNKYDLVFVAVHDGFLVLRAADIDSRVHNLAKPTEAIDNFNFRSTVSPVGQPRHLAVNSDSSILSVCLQEAQNNVVRLFDIQTLADSSKQPAPFLSIRLSQSEQIVDLAWNPSPDLAPICAVCFSDGSLKLLEVKQAGIEQLALLPAAARATCFCWSPKGKQLVVGKSDGTFSQYDQKLTEKKSIPTPSGLFNTGGSAVSVVDIFWESTLVFFVAYKPSVRDGTEQPSLVVVTLQKDGNPTFSAMEDVCFGNGESAFQKYFMAAIPDWNMFICSSSTSAETAVIGRHLQNTSVWERWCLDDTSRAEVPMTADYADAFPRGFGISFNSQREIPLNETQRHPPCPLLLLLSSEGLLVCFYMMYASSQATRVNVAAEALSGVPLRTGGGAAASQATQAQGGMPPPPAYGAGAVQPRATAPATHTTTAPPAQPSAGQSFVPRMPAQAGLQLQFGPQSTATSKPPSSQAGSQPQPSLQTGSQAGLFGSQSRSQPQPSLQTGSQAGLFGSQTGSQPQPGLQLGLQTAPFGSQPSAFGPQSQTGSQPLPGLQTGSQPTSSSMAGLLQQIASQAQSTASHSQPGMTSSRLDPRTQQSNVPAAQQPPATSGFQQSTGKTSASQGSPIKAQQPGSFPASGGRTLGGGNAADQSRASGNFSMSSTSFNFGQPLSQSTPAPGATKVVPQTRTGAQLVPDNTPAEPTTGIKSATSSISAPTSGLPRTTVSGAVNHPSRSAGALKSPAASQAGSQPFGGAGEASAAAQKVSSKRRSADMPENIFKHSIDEEVAHFERELSELRCRATEMSVEVGTKSEKDQLCRGTQLLVENFADVKSDTKTINEQVSDLKTSCIESFATIAQCNQMLANDGNPALRQLLRSRPLDPVREREMKSVRSLRAYVENEINKSDALLDEQWNDYQQQKKNKRIMTAPATDVIYRTISDNMKTIGDHKRSLERLSSDLRNLRLFNTSSSWQSTTLHSDNADISADALCQDFSSAVTVNGATPPRKKGISADREAQLRDVLIGRKVTPVKSTAPKNLSSSKIVSIRELREMFVTKSDESNGEVPAAATTKTTTARAQLEPRSSVVSAGLKTSAAAAAATSAAAKAGVQNRFGAGAASAFGDGPAGRTYVAAPTPASGGALAGILHGSQDAEAKAFFTHLLPGSTTGEGQSRPTVDSSKTLSAKSNPLMPTGFSGFGGQTSSAATSGSVGGGTGLAKYSFAPPSSVSKAGDTQPTVPKPSLAASDARKTVNAFAPVTAQQTKLNAAATAGIIPPNVSLKPQQPQPSQLVRGPGSGSNFTSQDEENYEDDEGEEYYDDGNESDEEDEDGEEEEEQRYRDEDTEENGNAAEFSRQASGPAVGLSVKPFSGFRGPTATSQPAAFSGFGAFKLPGVAASVGGDSAAAKFTFGAPVATETGNKFRAASSSPAPAGGSGQQTKLFPGLKLADDQRSSVPDAGNSKQGTTGRSQGGPVGDASRSSPDVSAPLAAGFAPKIGAQASGESNALAGAAAAVAVPKPADKDPSVIAEPDLLDSTKSASGGAASAGSTVPSTSTAESQSTANITSTASASGVSLFGKPLATVSNSSGATSATGGLPMFGQMAPVSAVVSTVTTTAAPVSGEQQPSTTSAAATATTTAPAPVFTPPSSTSSAAPAAVSTASTVASGSDVGSSAASTATAFGQPSTAASLPTFSSNLFGQASSGTSAFGQPATSASTSAFNQPSATPTASVFGQPASSGTSAFGQPTTSATSAFGQPSAAPSSTSIFGQPSNSGSSAFGQPANSGTSVFGQSTSSVAPVFGQAASSASIFGQPSSSSAFGQPAGSATSVFGQPASSAGTMSAFGQPTSPTAAAGGAGLKPFGFMASSSGGFGQSSAFGQPAFGQSAFGQPSAASGGSESGGSMFGSGFGLGGQPSAEKAKTNVFGMGSSGFGSTQTQQAPGIFGQSAGTSAFGSVKTQANISGAFSAGAGSVQSSGFGGFQKPADLPSGQFGAAPAFGSPPAFGASATPAFGSGAVFGSPTRFGSPAGFGSGAAFSSPFGGATSGAFGGGGSGFGTSGGSVFGQGDGAGGSNAFAALAQQSNVPTFGAIAQQQPGAFGSQQTQPSAFGQFGSAPQQPSAFGSPAFGSAQPASPSFTSYRS